MNELIGVALRVSVMYLYALALLRLSGKRSIGNLSPLDFAVAAILGDMFDDVFWAEIPVSQGLVGMGTVVLVHTLVSLVLSRLPALRPMLIGNSVTVLADGSLIREGMAKERTGDEEVWAEMHSEGIEEEKAEEVREAVWEPSGDLAVLRHKWAEPVQKSDLPVVQKALKARRDKK